MARGTPFPVMYPRLFNIVRHKHAKVAVVLGAVHLRMEFLWTLTGQHLGDWNAIVLKVVEVQLMQEHDMLSGIYTPLEVFLYTPCIQV